MKASALIALVASTVSLSGSFARGAERSSGTALMVGVGRADVTPERRLPFSNGVGDPSFEGINDRLFARALVLRSGGERAVLVVADAINLPDDLCDRLVARLSARYGIARDRVLLVATHVHTVPWTFDGGYERVLGNGVVAAVGAALRSYEPVTVAAGEGRALLNVNRDERTKTGFVLGQDPTGPSDKTVRVVAFMRNDGTPKAILANYAVHAVVLHSSATGPGGTALVSADLPGATDAWVDRRFPGATTFWTSGAAADQNPVVMSYYAEPGPDGVASPTDLGSAGLELVRRLGQNLGLQIARVVSAMRPARSTTVLAMSATTVWCPAKTGGGQVPIRLTRLRIGDVEMLGVSGELSTLIDRELRMRTRRPDLVTLTLAGGYAGYLTGDASYAPGYTFEAEHSRLKAGCAERAVVDGAVGLLARPALR